MTPVICADRRRILDAAGHVLVTGGPGCGKTFIALYKALTRIEAGLERGERVLFLSFSRAAVARILEEARKQLSADARALLDIQTFHSFFWQLVRGHGYLLGAPHSVKIMLPHDERALRNGASNEDPAWASRLKHLFLENGLLAFDQFAPQALSLLQGSAAVCKLVAARYPLIIVDEAQDTGADQWACIAALSRITQLVCLADPDQQIYDFRKDVSPHRLNEIMSELKPERVDLGPQNNRSPGVEIVTFGNDVLTNSPRGGRYKGVSQITLPPKAAHRDKSIRQAVGILSNLVEKRTGEPPKSIGFLTRTNRGVVTIAKALQGSGGQREIGHRLLIDEAEVLLGTRLGALLLEPVNDMWASLSTGLGLLADLCRAKSNIHKANQLERNASDARSGKVNGRARAPAALKKILEDFQSSGHTGHPRHDWSAMRAKLAESNAAELVMVSELTAHFLSFSRGRRVADALADTWLRLGTYARATQVIEAAVIEDQIIGSDGRLGGLNVMTMHKSKGKEFDGVIILHLGNISPLSSDEAPHTKSRKLLRVAITRARHEVLLLTDASSPSPLLAGHSLK